MVTLLSPSSCSIRIIPFKAGTKYARISSGDVAAVHILDDRSCERASTKVVGRSRYSILFSPEPLFFPIKYKRHVYSACYPHIRLLDSSLHPKTSWPCNVSLASQALSQISVQYKCIWWADLRLFHVPLFLDHYRLLLHILRFLAATTGFLSLASALFLLLKLSNWLHRQSKNPYTLDKVLNYLLLTSHWKLASLWLCGREWKLTLCWLWKKAWNTNEEMLLVMYRIAWCNIDLIFLFSLLTLMTFPWLLVSSPHSCIISDPNILLLHCCYQWASFRILYLRDIIKLELFSQQALNLKIGFPIPHLTWCLGDWTLASLLCQWVQQEMWSLFTNIALILRLAYCW